MKRLNVYLVALGVLLSGVFAVNGLRGSASAVVDNTPDCDTVAIIKCGAFSVSGLRDKYDKNTYGDLPKVYGAFGISRADLKGDFKDGIVWRNGDVTVGGKVVAKNAMTAGRNFGGTPIPGTQNAGKYPTSKFVTEGQTAFVRMIGGTFSFAIVKSCGNPVTAKPVAPEPEPTYTCNRLEKERISRNEFRFIAHANVSGGAEIVRYSFDFGDGETDTSTDAKIRHSYAKSGTYTAKVTAIVKVDGKNAKVTSGSCSINVVVRDEPVEKKPGISVEKTVDLVEHKTVGVEQQFTYQMTVKNTGNVELKNNIVSDNAPTGVMFVSASAGTITSTKWSHTVLSLSVGQSTVFTVTAKVPSYVAGTIKNTVCVDSPQINGNPDDCDDATVEVPKPVVGTMVVCEIATKRVITIKEDKFDAKLHSKDLNDCEKNTVPVCDQTTGKVIVVEDKDVHKYLPVDNTRCKVQGVTTIVTTTPPATPATPAESTPEIIVSTGPEALLGGLFGSGALGYGLYAYGASRRSVWLKMLGR